MTSEQLAWLIRRHGIEMTHQSHGSHIGGIMSVADILAVLYADILRVRPQEPEWPERDRFILSKGHAAAALYAVLAECGFISVQELLSHYMNGSRLSGHVTHYLPGIEFSTGSLGHGLSAAVGMAYAAKKDSKNHHVYTVIGDGECNEGSVWEAANFANHFRLNNLTVIVDYNHMQSLDFTENTMDSEDFAAKWRAFGWKVSEINGHDHNALRKALSGSKEQEEEKEHRPLVIIADTIKGYGVSFMENDILWHYRFPHEGWEYDNAVNELHSAKPEGVEDPYTPDGIRNPVAITLEDDVGNDHTLTATWHPSYPENMRRVEAKSGTDEPVHRL